MDSGNRKSPEGCVPAAILAAASILQNVVVVEASEGPSRPRADGDGDVTALQNLGHRESNIDRPVLDFQDMVENVTPEDDVHRRAPLDLPILDAEVDVSSRKPRSKKCAHLFGDDSDDDFVDSPPTKPLPKSNKKRTSLKTKRSCTPASSVSVAEDDNKMAVEGDNTLVTPYVLIPISPPTPKAPMLRAALTSKRRSKTVRGGATGENKSDKRQVSRRVEAKRCKVQTQTVPVAVEPSCSALVVTPEAAKSIEDNASVMTEQVSTQERSDSESEFDILSQEDDRNIMKRFCNIYRQSVTEYKSKKERFKATENSVKLVKMNMRGVDNDLRRVEEERCRLEEELRRLDEEHQRLVDRRLILTDSLESCRQDLEGQRGGLKKATKKVELFKCKFKDLLDSE